MLLPTIIIIVVSIFISAFFSGMEIAFASSNKLKLEIEKQQSRVFNFVAGTFSRHPGQYITTLLVGNNIALVIYSLQMSHLIQMLLFPESAATGSISTGSLAVETAISTIVIIFTAEFMPKAIVKLNPNFYYQALCVPAYLFYLLFFPISKLTTLLSFGILKLLRLPIKTKRGNTTFDRTDLAHLIDEASYNEEGSDQEKDIRLFQNALDFSELKVRDCMVPRVDIEAVEMETSIEEVQRRFIDTHFSRLLVYKENIDHIIGYINTKSLFTAPATINAVLQRVDYVPESMRAQQLLTTFIKKHHSIAVVIDEFGGTAGMATIEDILEEIFGEIEDEHDSQDLVEKKISAEEYILSGRLEVDYLNEKYDLEIPESDEYDTLAGYVISVEAGIPESGEVVTTDRHRIKVLRKDSSKLELLRVTIKGEGSNKI